MEPAVILRDVSKTFNGRDYVHRKINLEFPRGEITAVIGPSGTGKSVLLKMILALVRPTSGTVKVFGTEMFHLKKKELLDFRMKFGVLFQGAALFDDMTTLENVLFPLREHRRDLSDDDRREIAVARLKTVELEEAHFDKLPNELSGGMRKRVGLARAIALDPELVLYDEPTTGLDPILSETVANLILSTHRRREGTTSIVVSHDLSAAFRIADRVAMLSAGQVLLFGTPEDFYDSPDEQVRQFVALGVNK